MMALEALLPSEVARLVYGYLLDERCTEAAHLFLNESANLHECRSVLSHGKTFTTRVSGLALKDILESFCAANSIVQDKVSQLDNLDELNHCYDLVNQITFLLEKCRKQTYVVKVDASTQITPTNTSESSGKSQKTCLCLNNNEQIPTERFDKEVQTITLNHKVSAVEATLLQNLPGYISNSENGNCQMENAKNETQKVNLHEKQNEEIIPTSSKQYANSAVQTSIIEKCERLDKTVMTDIVEKSFNDHIDIEVQTSEIGSPDSRVPPSSVELLGDVTLELLNRTEIQERIAENINRILESKKYLYFSNKPAEDTKGESNKSFIAELNKTVQTAFNKTENDPEIIALLNEIIQPNNEAVSTEDESEMEVDNVDEFQENMDLDFGEAISEIKNNKETVLVESGRNSDQILREQSVSYGAYNTASAENNSTQVEFNPTHRTKSVADKVLLDNRRSQTKISRKNVTDGIYINKSEENKSRIQNNSDGTYTTTSAHNNIITTVHVKNNPSHSTKCITDKAVVEQIDVNTESSEVPNNTQNNLDTLASSPLSTRPLQQNPIPTSEHFFTHNNTITSTPLKTCTAVQGFDACDWFSTEALLTPDIDFHKHSASLFKINPYTACETVVTTTTLISPITSNRDTMDIAEKVIAINCTTADALKNRTLNTPDVSFPPKINFPSIPTNPIVPKKLPVSKDSEIQTSSEVKNDLPCFNSTQKVNGNTANNNSSSLSNEKLFGSESIMLYGMENNATTIPTLISIPEIEVEDSMTLTGTGLSPFIKINKKSNDTEIEKSNPITNNDILNGSPNEPIAVTQENQELSENILKANVCTTEVVTKSTPKILKENQSKNNRLSLSTPKKPSSHVRALNFETPVPRSQSESKANEKINTMSPASIMKELKNACKSSLFQSPEITNVEIIEQNDVPSENGTENVNPKNLKEQKIINDTKTSSQVVVPNDKNISSKLDAIKVQAIKKKSWDEDLRTMAGQPLEIEKEPSKKSKKKKKSKDSEKSKDKGDFKKSKKRGNSTPKELKNSDVSTPKKPKKSDKKNPKKSKKSDKKTPKKSKKKDESKTSSNEKNVSTEQTKINVKKVGEMLTLLSSVEEMTTVSNSSKETTLVPNSLQEMPLLSNSSEKIFSVPNSSKETTLVPNSLKEMPLLSNSPEKMSSVPNSSEELSIVPSNSKEMPISSMGSETTPIIPNSSKDEVIKATNDGILSNSVLEALLSNSINDGDAIGTTDVMKLAAEEMDNISKISHNESVSNIAADTNHDIAEKMQHDEELMNAAFKDKNVLSNLSPEKEIKLINDNKLKLEDVKNAEEYEKRDTQLNAEQLNVTPPFTNNSIITTVSSGSSQKVEVIYDKVSKIERGRVVQKKYARLHTLDTKIACKSGLNNFTTDIKSPHKDEDTSSLQVPPTPRVLSPGNSCSFLTMPVSKLGDESRKIRSFVTTPVDCPLTPEIVITPSKTQDENTAEALKNVQKNGTTSYFQPTFTTFEALKNSEIAQFEVIKENLKCSIPKTRSESEKTINDAPKDQINFEKSSNVNPKPLDEIEAIPRHQQRTVSSSSCSSASCSCCSSSLTSAAENYANNNNDAEDHNDNDNNGQDASSNNIPINIDEPKTRIETSPAKVFSIEKTDQELADTVNETPAKDENASPEIGIVDTPNVSKPAENPTNLNTKISQMIIMKEKEQMEKQQVTDGPKRKIISVERILPRIITKPSSQFIKALPLSMQRQSLELQKETMNRNSLFQRVKIEKTQEEVAQAVESITVKSDFKFNSSLEKSAESVAVSPVDKPNNLDNTPNKIELAKAIQSITTGEIDLPAYSPIKKVISEDDEKTFSSQSNSKFEQCISSDHSQDSVASKSEQNVSNSSTKWVDLNATCREIHIKFDGDHLRKRRRKKVLKEELQKDYCLDHGNVLHYYELRPTTFECIYNQVPPRAPRKKKGAPAKSEFAYFDTESQESTSTSSTVFSCALYNEKNEEKQNIKRKATDEFEQRTIISKRTKNLNFNQF